MSSDSDTVTSSSSEDERREKKREKLRKSEKKSKKSKKSKKKKSRKEKKRSRRASTSSDDSPVRPIVRPIAPARDNEANEDDAFGPALPPHLLRKPDKPIAIGPVLPEGFQLQTANNQKDEPMDREEENEQSLISPLEEQEDNDICGPLPDTNERHLTDAQIELEKRALELKMAALEGGLTNNGDAKVREEWMLELPDVGLKGGLAALNNMKRGFYQGKERPDFSDRSSWTKTPQMAQQELQQPGTSKTSKMLKAEALALYEKQRDDEQEAMAKKHKKKHKRDESLVDIHQKKLRKEEKRKAKELKESGQKPERRPFSRDIDLKLNKIDSNQTKQIVDKAKILDSKFSRGHAKYL